VSIAPAQRPLITTEGRLATEAWLAVNAPGDGALLGEVSAATVDDIDRAVKGAATVQVEWAALPATERARALRSYAALVDAEQPHLAELVHRETGKPLSEAQAEVARAAEVIHHFAAEAERLWVQQLPGSTLATGGWVRRPLGVVAAITPWNFPVALVVWKLAPALAAGNAVVVKPAIEAPLAAWALCDLAERSGLPAGLVSCLTGDGPLIGEALSTHPSVSKVAFTGSRRVAEQIAAWAAPRLKSLSLELGGHGALIVLPDADLDIAAEVAVMQGYVNSGQACYAVNRVLVPGPTRVHRRAHARPHRRSGRARGHRPRLGPPPHASSRTRAPARTSRERRSRWVARPALVTAPAPACAWSTRSPSRRSWRCSRCPDTAAALAGANRPDYGWSPTRVRHGSARHLGRQAIRAAMS
jgi:acyl-CoA reductase-like NAD-dependent aldehyde dehydrogenase